MRRRKRQGGFTILEMTISGTLILLTIGTTIWVQVNVLRGWEYGVQREQAEQSSQTALRRLRTALQEAAEVTVNSYGTTITYRYPSRDVNGDYIVPVTPENTTHAISLNWDSGDLSIDGQVILTNISRTGVNVTSYRPFTFVQVSPTLAVVHVRLNLQRLLRAREDEHVYAWVEEAIFLRNLQEE